MASLSNMSTFEQWLDKAATRGPDRVIPSSVAIAANKDGIIYSRSAGTQSEDPASPLFQKPMSSETTMWIASCTKFMTSIAILQLFEKGLIDLDAEVGALLPELADPDVFTGFNDAGEPTYEKAVKKITIRMMLSHQSGVGYGEFQPYIQQIRDFKTKSGEEVPSMSTWESHVNPLLAQPSQEWHYGASFELLGRLIERLVHTSLGTYMATHIWTPLSMTLISFSPHSHPISTSLTDASLRSPDGSLLPSPDHFFRDDTDFHSGGAGLYAAPSEYAKLLAAVLRNDGTLLRPETMDLLFTPHLSPEVQPSFDASVHAPGAEILSAALPREAELTQALGGVVCQADVAGRRRKGTLMWAGLANCFWSIDRVSGVALFWGSQVMPTSDVRVLDGFRRFEEGVYAGLV